MKHLLLLGALAASISTSAMAASFDTGEWVLARVPGNEYWFPGVVRGSSDGFVRVVFDDGVVENRPVAQVRAYDWDVGSKVECRYQGGADWYAGTITQMGADGESLSMLYDDGDREKTKTSRCRSR
jgi:hypothetical protein